MTPPVDGADFLAALEANCFLGALPPVDFLAVCLVLAIVFDIERGSGADGKLYTDSADAQHKKP